MSLLLLFWTATYVGGLAAAAAQGTETGKDILRTWYEDVLHGQLGHISSDGVTIFHAPGLPEPVRVKTANVSQIDIVGSEAQAPKDLWLLTTVNGDHLLGRLVSIDDSSVVLHTRAPKTIPLAQVAELRSMAGAAMEVHTDFSSGSLAGWTLLYGTSEFDEMGAVITSETNAAVYDPTLRGGTVFVHGGSARQMDDRDLPFLYIPCEQDGPYTYVLRIQQIGTRPASHLLGFFCDGKTFSEIKTGTAIHLDAPPRYIINIMNGRWYPNNIMRTGAHVAPKGYLPTDGAIHEWRVCYDPFTRDLKLWVNGIGLCDEKVEIPTTAGRYIFLRIGAKQARLLEFSAEKGIKPPISKSEDDPAIRRVMLASGDYVFPDALSYADGKFMLKTGFGEMQWPPERIAVVRLNLKRPASASKGQCLIVLLGRYICRMKVKELTEEELRGVSPELGELVFPRSLITQIRLSRGGGQ